MFDKAMAKHPDAKPIFHSDRGFQYTGVPFKSKLEKAEIIQSMSRVGKSFRSLEELTTKIVEYIEFYNKKRFQKRLN